MQKETPPQPIQAPASHLYTISQRRPNSIQCGGLSAILPSLLEEVIHGKNSVPPPPGGKDGTPHCTGCSRAVLNQWGIELELLRDHLLKYLTTKGAAWSIL